MISILIEAHYSPMHESIARNSSGSSDDTVDSGAGNCGGIDVASSGCDSV